jgi:hypothetical protein
MRFRVMVAAAIVANCVALSALADDSAVIATFTGNGDTNTRPFETQGSWEIRWQGDLEIYMRQINSNGDLIDTGHASGKDGSSFFPKAGRFFLAILPKSRSGTWSVTVTRYRP